MNTSSHGFDGKWWTFPHLRNALISGAIAGTGFLTAHTGLISHDVEIVFYFCSMPVGGYHWVREGLSELVHEHTVGINILMLAATIGSAILGLWDEAAALVFLYSAAEATEEYTYARTRHAIRALLDLAPREARLLNELGETMVPAASLRTGDRFLVRPGEALPTDGIIVAGTSSLDESPVTGEAMPVDKGPGMKVFAASINRHGALEIEATATFADNTLSNIIRLVEEAQERKGRAQQWIERFGNRYTPMVLSVALLLILIPWFLGLALDGWLLRAVLLLVAAAPCALVMSTPVAMAAGIGSAGRRGILIKGGAHLEHLGSIKLVAFDKTGTLTYGSPQLTDILPVLGSEAELLELAWSLERYSEHPLSQAIRDKAQAIDVAPLLELSDFKALAGMGAQGTIKGEMWYIGNPALFAGMGVALDAAQATITEWQQAGKTVVLVGNATHLRGLLAFQDGIRADARAAVDALRADGLEVAMLTGDNEHTAHTVAASLGIREVRASLKPDEKVAAVRELEARYGAVLMVGDGVNDAPALAAATCGVAMGAAGSDAAIEAADVALMADDLGRVAEALRLGRKARRISVQNIVFAITVLLLMIPSALGGLLTVAVTVLVHEVSELLAVMNGLRVGWRTLQNAEKP